jgi:hypothetical protein
MMATVRVYRFQMYDISANQMMTVRRWGTPEAIEAIRGSILKNQSIEVDEADLKSDIDGLTRRDWTPSRVRDGFLARVD